MYIKQEEDHCCELPLRYVKASHGLVHTEGNAKTHIILNNSRRPKRKLFAQNNYLDDTGTFSEIMTRNMPIAYFYMEQDKDKFIQYIRNNDLDSLFDEFYADLDKIVNLKMCPTECRLELCSCLHVDEIEYMMEAYKTFKDLMNVFITDTSKINASRVMKFLHHFQQTLWNVISRKQINVL